MMESSAEPRKSPKGFFVVWWARICHQTWFDALFIHWLYREKLEKIGAIRSFI